MTTVHTRMGSSEKQRSNTQQASNKGFNRDTHIATTTREHGQHSCQLRVFADEARNAMKQPVTVAVAVVAAVACVVAAYETPRPTGDSVLFFEPFDSKELPQRWTLSTDPKYAPVSALELREATYAGGRGDKALMLKEAARYYGLSAPLANEGWSPAAGKPLVVQYEVRLGKEHECGGVYLKLLSANASHADPLALTDKTPFTVMFGPDHCGGDTNKGVSFPLLFVNNHCSIHIVSLLLCMLGMDTHTGPRTDRYI